MTSLTEEAEIPQVTGHLDNPLPAGAKRTGEGTALLAAFGTAMGTTDTGQIKKSTPKNQHIDTKHGTVLPE